MQMGVNLGQVLKQEQKLTQQMIQSLNLLAANEIELEAMIKDAVEENPLLEVDFPEDKKEQLDQAQELAEANGEKKVDSSGDEIITDSSFMDSSDFDDYLNEGFDLGYSQSENMATISSEDEKNNFEAFETYEETMYDSLENQLKDRRLKDQRLHVLVDYLIASLDSNGFLTPSDPELLKNLKAEKSEELPISEEDLDSDKFSDEQLIKAIDDVIEGLIELNQAPLMVREAIHILQSFDPPGIGARNLQESLLIQAYRKDNFSKLAIKILDEYFELLINRKIPDLSRKLGKKPIEIQEAIEMIAVLSPHPGKLLGGDDYSVISPDLSVEADEQGIYRVTGSYERQPRLRISKTYRQILENKNSSKEDIKFVKEKLLAANILIKTLEDRKSTIQRVMEKILKHQSDFFYKGPENLKPLILDDIATEIGVHITTVSRVTKGKYVQTPHGTFELKHFFTSSVKQEDGSEISNAQAKSVIKTLIAEENPQKPLSDQKIVDYLIEKNIKVARRTVAKYRDKLGILPARQRKKF